MQELSSRKKRRDLIKFTGGLRKRMKLKTTRSLISGGDRTSEVETGKQGGRGGVFLEKT